MPRTLQIYATGSGTANAVAQVTIPSSTTIRAVQVMFTLDSITDNGMIRIELSKIPVSQIGTNGAQDPFLAVGLFSNFNTSGQSVNGIAQVFPVSVACRQGEIVYLHSAATGTATFYFNGILWF